MTLDSSAKDGVLRFAKTSEQRSMGMVSVVVGGVMLAGCVYAILFSKEPWDSDDVIGALGGIGFLVGGILYLLGPHELVIHLATRRWRRRVGILGFVSTTEGTCEDFDKVVLERSEGRHKTQWEVALCWRGGQDGPGKKAMRHKLMTLEEAHNAAPIYDPRLAAYEFGERVAAQLCIPVDDRSVAASRWRVGISDDRAPGRDNQNVSASIKNPGEEFGSGREEEDPALAVGLVDGSTSASRAAVATTEEGSGEIKSTRFTARREGERLVLQRSRWIALEGKFEMTVWLFCVSATMLFILSHNVRHFAELIRRGPGWLVRWNLERFTASHGFVLVVAVLAVLALRPLVRAGKGVIWPETIVLDQGREEISRNGRRVAEMKDVWRVDVRQYCWSEDESHRELHTVYLVLRNGERVVIDGSAARDETMSLAHVVGEHLGVEVVIS